MSDRLQTLTQAAEQLGLALSAEQLQTLLRYLDLILKWNKVYNLTAVRDPDEALTHHLIDSLAAVPPLQKHLATLAPGARLLDVGSGGGLPGVVFAICCPDLHVSCVDTVGKKAAFVQQVALELKLRNLRGVHARVENLKEKFEVVSSRAFASLLDFTTWSVSSLAEQGVWLAMKGKHPDAELAVLPTTVAVFHVEQLTVPGLDAERCIIWMKIKNAVA
ncbi:16S rRNA m(7)G-527 methyltransferase [Rhodoferax sp. OV413]|uniref:16S rRNA (guanine(527)-N(7))-methyltransferase RsmG n=1 Tax=Rhodoferax sp. OV413 TaxID=1855285 RepID=UPI00088448BE|nr:16S rRNA (guanine(527)-N(7))-methyltransferase RsmG [Rhodoferax sp. OV413]SDO66620.1 16S rRNA m(7)G-527 methyltransferase [Rhodoferax sp. OV413]